MQLEMQDQTEYEETKFADGTIVKWKKHPIMDRVEEAVIPPYAMSHLDSDVTVQVTRGLFESVNHAREGPKQPTLSSLTNSFLVVATFIQEDFFEDVYQLRLRRADTTPFKSPVTYLRIQTMSFEYTMLTDSGLSINDPLHPFKILGLGDSQP